MKSALIIDDERKIRTMYGNVLAREGYEIYEADSAEIANEFNKWVDMDLILLDIRMPSVSGRDFFEIVDTFHRRPRTIICSVYPEDEQRKLVPGADEYFDKSEGIEQLLKKIRKLDGVETEDL